MKRKELTAAHTEEFTAEQERVHASLHFLGILFGLIAVPVLLYFANGKDRYSILGISIYGLCFMMVFTFSTLYHWFMERKRKRLFKKLDRISIYFLIAGTYTPLIKFYLFDEIGIMLLTVVWSLVIIGIFFEIYFPDQYGAISVLFYLFMGLLFMFVPSHFFAAMPLLVTQLMLGGVAFYVVGVIFYVWQRWEYHHAVWHIFVLSGSICHYLALLYTV